MREGTRTMKAKANLPGTLLALPVVLLAALLVASAPALGQEEWSYFSPRDQETGVYRDTSVGWSTYGSLDRTTVNTATFTLVKQGTTTPVEATVTYHDACERSTEWMWFMCGVALFPKVALEANTTYTATLKGGDTGVKWSSAYGGTPIMPEDYSWSFTTGDTTSPPETTIQSGPSGNTTSSSATFGFSSSESGSTFQCKLDNGTYASCSSTKQYTDLAPGSHTFSVKAIDQAGIEDETPATYTWTVTVDTTAPTVSKVYPASGATGAGRHTDIAAMFSEVMDPKTLITTPTDPADPTRGTSTTVTLVKDGTTTPISANVMYTEYWNDHRVIPSPPFHEGFSLDANTKYTVKIKGGTNGVKDLAGNQLGGGNQASGDYWWSFTTDAPSCTKTGTSNAETISGTSGDDVICAGGGNDTVKGLGGNDTLKGEDGNDTLIGGTGNDALDGGPGTDTASYAPSLTAVTASLATNAATGEGSDTFVGTENLLGSPNADALTGSGANNTLTGGGGNDTERGGAGNDKVVGGSGGDFLYGEDGADAVDSRDGTNGNDSLDGGSGTADTKVTDASEKSVVGFP
jgi:Ca2+-binding RTX toxin-like protein